MVSPSIFLKSKPHMAQLTLLSRGMNIAALIVLYSQRHLYGNICCQVEGHIATHIPILTCVPSFPLSQIWRIPASGEGGSCAQTLVEGYIAASVFPAPELLNFPFTRCASAMALAATTCSHVGPY